MTTWESARGVGGSGSDVERGRGTLSKVMLCYAENLLRKEEGVYSEALQTVRTGIDIGYGAPG